jgi:chromosome segregation ATPase
MAQGEAEQQANELSAAKSQLSSKTATLTALQTQFDAASQQVQRLERELDVVQASMASLKQEHAARVEEVTLAQARIQELQDAVDATTNQLKTLTDAHAAATRDLATNAALIASLQAKLRAADEHAAQQRQAYDSEIARHEGTNKSLSEQLQVQQQEHASLLEAAEARLARELDTLRRQHDRQLLELQEQHGQQLDVLRKEHQEQVRTMREQLHQEQTASGAQKARLHEVEQHMESLQAAQAISQQREAVLMAQVQEGKTQLDALTQKLTHQHQQHQQQVQELEQQVLQLQQNQKSAAAATRAAMSSPLPAPTPAATTTATPAGTTTTTTTPALQAQTAVPTATSPTARGTSPAQGPSSQQQQQQIVICFSGLEAPKVEQLTQLVNALGSAQVLANSEFHPNITHIVTPPDCKTMKALAGILTSRWLVTPEWVVESAAGGHWLPEDTFGTRMLREDNPVRGKAFFLTPEFRKDPSKLKNCETLLIRVREQCPVLSPSPFFSVFSFFLFCWSVR